MSILIMTVHDLHLACQDLPLFRVSPEAPNVGRLKALLGQYDHLTRAELHKLTSWSERDIRALAEAAGPDVVRGQAGFSLFDSSSADEVLSAAETAISQGKKMIGSGVGLKRRLHARIA